MKKFFFSAALIAVLTVAAGSALADNIKGRLGVTGRLGFIVPADNGSVSTDTGIIGGGGFIYGLTNDVALDLDITHAAYGSNVGFDFNTTNISLGAQYRFIDLPYRQLVPFVGGGLDILVNGVSDGLDADTVVGAHVKGGVDYFITRELAATAEIKGVLAPDADVHDVFGRKAGSFDPMSFSTTFGVRYFFN